jgi:hypothetical protein
MEGAAVTHVEIREASARLPERQGEALALRDRDGRSYEEIATSLEIGPGAVAQLIAHARINLYDELRGTALASVAPSPECERALPLIAMREDGQLEPASEDARWLDSHLANCDRCALAVEQMGEAEAAYRAQEPERPGDDDRTDGPADRIRRPGARRPLEPAGIPVATPMRRSRRMLLVACLAGLLLLGVVAAVLAATDRSTPRDAASAKSAGEGSSPTRSGGEGKKKDGAGTGRNEQTQERSSGSGENGAGSADGLATTATTAPAASPVESGSGGAGPGSAGSGGNSSSGKAAVEPTRRTSSKPSAKPKSPPASTSAPQSTTTATAPAPEPPPAAEAEVDEPGHRGEPPGKAVGRPPR